MYNSLNFLLKLTKSFCKKYQVQLSSEKTKLLAYAKKDTAACVEYWKYINPIEVNGTNIQFYETAENVAVVRSVTEIFPHSLPASPHTRELLEVSSMLAWLALTEQTHQPVSPYSSCMQTLYYSLILAH